MSWETEGWARSGPTAHGVGEKPPLWKFALVAAWLLVWEIPSGWAARLLRRK